MCCSPVCYSLDEDAQFLQAHISPCTHADDTDAQAIAIWKKTMNYHCCTGLKGFWKFTWIYHQVRSLECKNFNSTAYGKVLFATLDMFSYVLADTDFFCNVVIVARVPWNLWSYHMHSRYRLQHELMVKKPFAFLHTAVLIPRYMIKHSNTLILYKITMEKRLRPLENKKEK